MFAPHQIVCLECDQTYLYGEVIQVVEDRQLCWLRPMVIVYHASSSTEPEDCRVLEGEAEHGQGIEPLTEGPDLLWPVNQLRLALDTDVIPLLASIERAKATPVVSHQRTQHLLRQFIDQLWAKASMPQ